MGSVLHGSARTTPRIRAELQASQASTRSLAAEYGLNPKTVKKWRGRTTTADAPMGPKAPRSTVLTAEEEAMAVASRRHKVHAVLTDNGTHFTTPGNVCSAAKDIRAALDAGEIVWAHHNAGPKISGTSGRRGHHAG
jgi:hypothetical protein